MQIEKIGEIRDQCEPRALITVTRLLIGGSRLIKNVNRDCGSNGAKRKRGQAALESSNRRVKRVALKVKRFIIIVSLART